MGGDSGEVHLAAVVFDHDEDVDAAQEDGVDVDEVAARMVWAICSTRVGSAVGWPVGLVVGAGRSSGGRRVGRASAAAFAVTPAAAAVEGWAAVCSAR